MHYLQRKDFVQCPSDMTRHTGPSFQHYKMDVLICLTLSLCNGYWTETVICPRRSSCYQEEEDGGVGAYQHLYLLTQSCIRSKGGATSSPVFINEVRTKYVCVGFYPARDYLPLVEFEVVRRAVDPKPLFSVMNKWTHWRRPSPNYGTTCVLAKRC